MGGVMPVINVTTLTVQSAEGWGQMVQNHNKAKVLLEKYGARNVRLLVPISGAEPSGTAHSVFEADDLASLGKILDSTYTDPDMVSIMMRGAESASWTNGILMELPDT
jgi:hypothetical protein